MNFSLRPYQTESIKNISQAYQVGAKAPIVVIPTGGGKTLIFCTVTRLMVPRKRRVLILVHRQELLRQTSEKLEQIGVQHGLIAAGCSMSGDPVQVASVQTLVRRMDRVQPPDLIIIDEAHHANAGTWRKILDNYPAAKLLGVTATPCRLDGTGLGVNAGGFFDTMISGPTISELINGEYLAPPVVYAPPSGIDLFGVHTRAGDYVAGELEAAVDKPKITGSAIEHYKRICPGVPALGFCTTIKHAEHTAQQFSEAGIRCDIIHGALSDQQRKHRIWQLGNRQLEVLFSVDVVSEGTDIPVVTAAILLRPTQSTGLYMQQVGRVLRPHPGKTYAIILDHVGNCLRHGLPDQDREWSLDGEVKRKKRDKENGPQIRQCEKCYAVYSATQLSCPQCGHVNTSKSREIKQVDGELCVITKDMIAVSREEIKQRFKQGRCRTLPDLLAYAKVMGHNPKWAYHIWNARQAKERMKAVQNFVNQEAMGF